LQRAVILAAPPRCGAPGQAQRSASAWGSPGNGSSTQIDSGLCRSLSLPGGCIGCWVCRPDIGPAPLPR
jgi:hypothetical protein